MLFVRLYSLFSPLYWTEMLQLSNLTGFYKPVVKNCHKTAFLQHRAFHVILSILKGTITEETN